MRSHALPSLALLLAVCAVVGPEAQSLRKIGEMELALVGLSATLDAARPAIPKNVGSGVKIVISAGGATIAPAAAARLIGGFTVEGELSGPSLGETVTVRRTVDAASTGADLVLPLPPMAIAGEHTLSNLRIVNTGGPLFDVQPHTVAIDVIEQVLIASVKTRPLTLQEIRDKGIVLDGDDYLAFEFTLGLLLESKPIKVAFPVVFDREGVPVPTPLSQPTLQADSLHEPLPMPRVMPMFLKVPKIGSGGEIVKFDGDEEPKILSLLVIPGEVGYLKQFFSAQLFIANGTPGTANLVVRDVTGTMILSPGLDLIPGSPDDPLSPAETVNGIQPMTMPIAGVGADGAPGTADDVTALRAGEQGMAEFLVRGDWEGFHPLAFDIKGTLDGLPTGPIEVSGRTTGGVLVRNPNFDVSFTVPTVIRRSEPFTLYATVSNKGQGLANDVSMTLDSAALSGLRLLSDASQTIDTLMPGDAKTLAFEFEPLRTGQVIASYLRFEGPGGPTGNLVFKVGIGERGVVLSPDTLVLPAQVDELPLTVVDAAMRVLGQAWSIANSPANTLPAGVIRVSKPLVTAKALALAEAGLRITLGQSEADAIRDLLLDFYGPSPVDRGFDQLLRTTNAGRAFNHAVGAALGPLAGADPAGFEQRFSQVAASGRDFIAFSVSDGGNGADMDVTLTDVSGRVTVYTGQDTDARPAISSAAIVPLGPPAAAPLFGLVATPSAGPYTLDLTGRGSGALDLSVTYPRGDGQFMRAVVSGALIAPGAKARFAIDPSRASPTLDIDTDANGTVDVSLPMSVAIISATPPQLVSASVVGPETLPNAGVYGFNVALLFDRGVDPKVAADVSRYSVPDNRMASARAQLSGRLVFGTLAQPEGPYVPSSVTVAGMADLRGSTAGTEMRSLQSRLEDPGAVVSGRVINGEGGIAAGIRVIYRNNVSITCESPIFPVDDHLAAVVTDGAGRYQFRYVWRDRCGGPWTMRALDEVRQAERSASGTVRAPGERVQADIAMLGRGAVTGIVRTVSGTAVANAQVIAVSVLEQKVGGATTTDGDGRYTIANITVGPVTVKAASGFSIGTATAQIARAGTTAIADVTLNSGSVSVSGVVKQVENGVATLSVGVSVVFETPDVFGKRITGAALTGPDGSYAFVDMPSGSYTVRARNAIGDFGSVEGVALPGDAHTGRDVSIFLAHTGRISGVVRYPDGTPAERPIIYMSSGGAQGEADGTFALEKVSISDSVQTITAHSADGLREGAATVLVTQQGQSLTGVVVTLNGVGTLDLVVIDSLGQPVRNQLVQISRTGKYISPNDCTAFHLAPTDAQGRVQFAGLEVGAVRAVSIRSTATGVDIATLTSSIPYDGATVTGVLRFGGGGTVTGTVRDDRGDPVFGAEIEIQSRIYNGGSCAFVVGVSHRIRTDLTGQYRATGVPVGSVKLTASHFVYSTPVGAQGVIARDGDQLVLDLQLINTVAGELSGTVFLPDGVTPAGAGVTVTAAGKLPDVVVSTDDLGQYHFPKIFPAGQYQVTVRDPRTGGVNQSYVALHAGLNKGHNFRLKGRGTVRVKVVDGAGVVVPTALVTLAESDFPGETYEDVVEPSNEGVVSFDYVHEGRFSVTASDIFARGGRVSGELPGPGATVDVTVRLTVTGRVAGHFYMPDGTTPIPFGTVQLIAANRIIGQAGTSSGEDPGAFEFSYVPAGTVRLEALDPATGRSGVAIGHITTDGQLLPLDVRAQGLIAVTGVVRSGLAEQDGARVTVKSGSFNAQTTANSSGTYYVPGVPEGLITVTADLQGALPGMASATLLGDGLTLTLDIALQPSGTVAGIVTAANGATPAPPSIVAIKVGQTRFTATTNDLGAYRFDVVPAGIGSMTVDVIGGIDTAIATANVIGGQTTTVPLQLIGLGSITGSAQDASGAPVSGTVTITGSGVVPYTLTLTVGPDGAFHAAQVLAGPFSAKVRNSLGGITLYGTATATVSPGDTATVIVSLQSTGEIRGVVRRSDGATAAIGAGVTVKTGAAILTTTQVSSDGSFAVTGAPLGTYSVTVYDPVSDGYARALDLVIAANGDVADAGVLVLDDTRLSVQSVTPADGAIGVSRTTPIVVTFTDPVTGTGSVNVKKDATTLGAARSLSADGRTLTLTATWPDSSEITVEVTTGVTDVFGRHPVAVVTSRFHTVDTTAPSVAAVSPAHDAFQVPVAAAIEVTFSESIANASVDGLIAITGPAGLVAGTATLGAPNVMTFAPASALAGNAKYTVTVDGAADASGNEQGSPFVSTFATVDTVAPVLTVTSPALAGWVSDATPLIQVTLSDAVSGVLSTTGTLALDGAAVTPTTKTASLISFTAPALADGSHTIDATVADRAGNVGSVQGSFMLDATDPSVPVITNITEGQVVAGQTTITASATDATSGVDRIEVRRDTTTILTLLPPAFTGTWPTSSTADDAYELTARAVDEAGNAGAYSAPVGIVVNNEPLVVTITEPAANLRTRRPVTATATLNEPVARVDFTLGGVTVSDTSSPYSVVLDVAAVPEGNAVITYQAVGLFGEVATATRTIIIDRSSPVARWPFDEGTGTTTADSSGNGHTGTLVNGAAWSAVGQFGKSILFDGIAAGVTAADADDLDITTALTLSAWVAPTTTGSTRSLIVKAGGPLPAYTLSLGPDGRAEAVIYPNGSAAVAQSVAPLPLQAWTHVAATYDGTTLRLFVNGAEVANVPASGVLPITDGDLWLGRDDAGTVLAGRMDDIRIYDRALSSAEVVALAAPAAGGNRLAGGYRASFIAQPGGPVWAMGQSYSGDLGTGTNAQHDTPTLVVGLSDVADIAAGDNHAIALTTAGTVYTWGDNLNGALGDGTTTDRSTPTPITLDSVVAIAAGRYHSLALRSNGDVYAFGQNSSGQIGDGTTANSLVPRLVMGGVRAIGAGSWFSLFVKNDGTVWGVGANYYGQLGDGTKVQRLTPVQMSGVTGAAAVAASEGHTVVLLSDGTLRATGQGFKIGDGGNQIDRTTAVAVTGMTNVTAVAAGVNHTVAVRSDGTVWAWGYNSNGQLGDGTTTTRLTPVQVPGLVSVEGIGAGFDHSLAATADGQILTWGDGGYGVLGDGASTSRLSPVAISIENYVWKVATPTLSVGSGTGIYNANYTVAVNVATAGATIHYTRDGSEPTESDPTVAPGGSLLVDVSQTLTARAWRAGQPPSNSDARTYEMKVGFLNISPGGTYTSPRTVTITSYTPDATLYYTTDGSEPSEASTRYTAPFTVATTTTLKVRGFKAGWTPSTTQTTIYTMSFGTLAAPVIAPGPGTYVGSVAVTLSASQPGATIRYTTNNGTVGTSSLIYRGPFALTTTTTVKAKAFHTDYLTSVESSAVFTLQATAPTFSLAAGTYDPGTAVTITGDPATTIRYTVDGSDPTTSNPIIASGSSRILGNFTLKARAFLTGADTSAVTSAAFGLSGALAPATVTAGTDHSLAVTPDGRLFGWGYNLRGQLGDGNAGGTRPLPAVLNDLTGIVATAAGNDHTLALTADGRLWAFGYNLNGQLGDGTPTQRSRPVPVSSVATVVAVAAGLSHSVALLANGDAYTWGLNTSGQLGDGTTGQALVPRLVMTGVRAIGAGSNHTLFVKLDGTVWGSGFNASGQLGDGTTTARISPVQMSGIAGAAAATGGYGFSVVRLEDGTLRSSGDGSKLGDGTQTQRTTPVTVVGMSNVVAVDAGVHHTIALTADGAVWAWGGNSSGQVGNLASATYQLTALQATGLSNVIAIAAGGDHSMALTADHVVYGWGSNGRGELGDGGNRNRPRATPISAANYEWKAATPTLSINSGTFTTSTSVVVAALTPGATIHYTRTGAEPTEADPVVATGGTVVVDYSQTLSAKAFKAGMPPSNTEAQTYQIQVAQPVVLPAAATYNNPANVPTVTMSTTTPGAIVYYTLDGSEPTEASFLYSTGFTVATTTTVKAKSFKAGLLPSTTRSVTYTMNFGTLTAPTIAPGTGTYVGSVTVTLSAAQSGATIRYTTTGSSVGTGSPISAGEFTVSVTTTVKAKAFHPDYTASPETSAVFTVQASAPVFTLSSGTYGPGTAVTITGAPATTIRYTLDGSDPTTTGPIVASGSSLIVGNFTLKARAFGTNMNASAVTSATYQLSGALSPGGLAGGSDHSMLVTPDGRLATWGHNANGQLGDGSTTNRSAPGLLPELTGVVAVAGGSSHSLALTSDGRLFAWGFNSVGQLGDGTATQRTRPVPVTSLSNVVAVATGTAHNLALTADGQVWAWGFNGYGQLGNGSTAYSAIPLLVGDLPPVVAVAAGYSHSVAVTGDGRVFTWGHNGFGQLGGSNQLYRTTPGAVASLEDVIAAAAAAEQTFAMRRDGRVFVWGSNTYGELGLTPSAAVVVPTENAALNASAAAPGWFAGMAMGWNGSLLSWGRNLSGQLGDGTSVLRSAPQPIQGLSNVSSFFIRGHSAAMSAAGDVWTWGYGGTGNNGDGTLVNRSTPQLAFTMPGAWAPAAPVFSIAPGSYIDPFTLVVSSSMPGAVIRYTLDGSTPTEADTEAVDGEIYINASVTVRARVFVPGRAPSAITTVAYVITP